MGWQALAGSENIVVIFDDNASVWDENWGNLIPIPPYCYWEGDVYWSDEYLSSKASILSSNDEIIGKGPLTMAWDVTLSLVSSAISHRPPRGLAGCSSTSVQQMDIRIILKEQRRQVGCYRYMAWLIVVSVVSCAQHLLCDR